MYPSIFNETSGIFVYEQLKALLKVGRVDIQVLSPVPLSPFPITQISEKWNLYSKVPRESIRDGIKVWHPRYIRLPGSKFHGPSGFTMHKSIESLFKHLRKSYNPDIIHAFAATPDGYAGLMLARKYRIPFVCSLMGSDINVYPSYRPLSYTMTRKVLLESDRVIAVSNALKDKAETIVLAKQEIRVIYMGVDTENFVKNNVNRNEIRTNLDISPNEIVLLFVGGLLISKGVFELIESFAKLYKSFNNSRLILVGEGPAKNKLLERIRALGIQDFVYFVGRKPHDEIPEWLNACDIFVLPSYSEGLPNALVEAMACKCPVVATRVGGIPEVLKNKENGLLIKPQNVGDLTESLIYLISHREEAIEMGERAWKTVLENYTWDKNAEKTIKIYREVLNGR